MNDVEFLVKSLGHNWLMVVTGAIVAWLLLTRIVETSEAAAKLLGPLGRKIAKSYQERSARYRSDVAQEAKLLALELIPKVEPSDYGVVKQQLRNIISRVTELELENSAMRGFIVLDEEWHFRHELAYVAQGGDIADLLPRMGWSAFLEQWKLGRRPSTA